MATDRVFVSPGVYTSEKDISFVQRQVGVTTLGLVGETVKGPAFEPIFVTNYNEYKSFFGGQDPTIVDANNAPRYELPYIAKSYLTESNQLFVTRVLGLSGYDAGYSWGITLDGALDDSTTAQTQNFTYTGELLTYSATTGGSITNIDFSDSLMEFFYDEDKIDDDLEFLATASVGDTSNLGPIYDKPDETNPTFTGLSYSLEVTEENTVGTIVTGTTSGTTTYFSGSSYTDVDNRIVALLRSRGSYGGDQIIDFEVTGSTIGISSTGNTAEEDPLGIIRITGTSTTNGYFEYPVSFDNKKKNYISRVLGRGNKDGNSSVFVEELYKTMLDRFITDDKVRGINLSLVNYDRAFDDYKEKYQAAVTHYFVSEVRGNKIIRLFRVWTISDGDAANSDIKVSIENIKPDDA